MVHRLCSCTQAATYYQVRTLWSPESVLWSLSLSCLIFVLLWVFSVGLTRFSILPGHEQCLALLLGNPTPRVLHHLVRPLHSL